MSLFRNYSELSSKPRVICLGNFDGLHRGHQKVIQCATEEAKRRQLASTLFTFDPHPREFFGRPSESLMSLDDRIDLLGRFHTDEILVQHFDASFSQLLAKDFIEEILIRRLNAKVVVIGRRFHFGFKAEGTSALLRRYANDFDTIEVEPLVQEGLDVSSSQIRHFLKEGRLKEAQELLGAPPFIAGRVVAGDARGRDLGFPTANLDCDPKSFAIHYPHGVYACLAQERESGFLFEAVANFGTRPTFRERKAIWEIHFLHFRDDLYGRHFRLFLIELIRAERAFGSATALIEQINDDCLRAQRVLRSFLLDEGVKIVTNESPQNPDFEASLAKPRCDLQSLQLFKF